MNFVFLLTEGDHDSAFLYRILKANGVETWHKKIKEYPKQLSGLFTSALVDVSIEDLNIEHARTRFLPTRVMKKEDNVFIIYSMSGDEQRARRISLITTLNDLAVVDDPDAFEVAPGANLKVLYFLDADNKGVVARLEQVRQELSQCFDDKAGINELQPGVVVQIEDMWAGAFVFVEQGTDVGMLENVLIPLMSDGNIDIFSHAEKFLSIHEQTQLFAGTLVRREDQSIKSVKGKKFAINKSLIGTVGQLQMSGKSNTTCITDADFLDDKKILASKVCQDIIQFVSQAAS